MVQQYKKLSKNQNLMVKTLSILILCSNLLKAEICNNLLNTSKTINFNNITQFLNGELVGIEIAGIDVVSFDKPSGIISKPKGKVKKPRFIPGMFYRKAYVKFKFPKNFNLTPEQLDQEIFDLYMLVFEAAKHDKRLSLKSKNQRIKKAEQEIYEYLNYIENKNPKHSILENLQADRTTTSWVKIPFSLMMRIPYPFKYNFENKITISWIDWQNYKADGINYLNKKYQGFLKNRATKTIINTYRTSYFFIITAGILKGSIMFVANQDAAKIHNQIKLEQKVLKSMIDQSPKIIEEHGTLFWITPEQEAENRALLKEFRQKNPE